jgi:hypothetical protein
MADSDVTRNSDSAADSGADRDDIEVGESLEIDVLVSEDGSVAGAVIDELIVATGPEGSVTDEIIDVLDSDGELILEDEIVTVYDADGNVVAKDETVIAALDDGR